MKIKGLDFARKHEKPIKQWAHNCFFWAHSLIKSTYERFNFLRFLCDLWRLLALRKHRVCVVCIVFISHVILHFFAAFFSDCERVCVAVQMSDRKEHERVALQRYLATLGRIMVETTSDGSCLYGSVAHQLQEKGISSDSCSQVKQRALAWLHQCPLNVGAMCVIFSFCLIWLACRTFSGLQDRSSLSLSITFRMSQRFDSNGFNASMSCTVTSPNCKYGNLSWAID